jgi:hypothetical protein
MKMTFQTNIDQPTQELTEQVLKDLTQSATTSTLIDGYRQLKRQMAEAEANQAFDAFISDILNQQDYKTWLVQELKKDVKRTKKRMPDNDQKRVKLYISQLKTSLPTVIPTAWFTESSDRWNRKGLWRVQANGYLTSLAVLDADHVPNPEAIVNEWLKRDDFKELGIVWIFITPSGEGIKVVFRARADWGNLQDNAYQMAEILGVLDYADGQCKNSDHAHFVPKAADIKYIDWAELFGYENPSYEQRFGEAYRRGESEPTQPKWQELEQKRKDARKRTVVAEKPSTEVVATPVTATVELTERDKAIIKALNDYYPDELPEGQKHPTFTEETSHWLCWLTDNTPAKAIAMSLQLNWVKAWTNRQPNEIEDLINSASKKKILVRSPKKLKELLIKAGLETDFAPKQINDDDLPFEDWIEQIRGLFDIYPCVREICEPHPEKLWPFLLFAAAAFLGTDMTLCWYYFYDQPEKRRRLNYNVLGIGDPAVGKGPLERIENLLTEPMDQADQLANDAINNYKENSLAKGVNKDKGTKPKVIVRKHGARTSNNVFINDMVNAWTEVDGERMQLHMLTTDTEALNSIKMQKGGSWIDKQVMEIKAWSNERDSQQYANNESVTGPFNVYWNLVRTCTPPALKVLVNERNFGSGYPLRLYVLPVPDKGFEMIPLRRKSKKDLDSNDVIRQWGYRMDKRQGELPIWSLVEHSWHWTNDHMEIAAFNEDKADRMLLKRCAVNGICAAAPWVDMRHWDEREKTGTYEPDEQDKELLDLVLDIQYKTQRHYFYELARNYYDEQTKDATQFRRRTTRYAQCFQKLPDPFTTEQFAQVFGFANNRSANKAINRMLHDKAIERTKRGEYRKRVQNID